jgi:hypothetical protein
MLWASIDNWATATWTFLFPNTFFHVETELDLGFWPFAGWLLMVGPDLLDWHMPYRSYPIVVFWVCRRVQWEIFVEWPALPHAFLRVFADRKVAPETVSSSSDWNSLTEMFPPFLRSEMPHWNAQFSSNLRHLIWKSLCMHRYFKEQVHNYRGQ